MKSSKPKLSFKPAPKDETPEEKERRQRGQKAALISWDYNKKISVTKDGTVKRRSQGSGALDSKMGGGGKKSLVQDKGRLPSPKQSTNPRGALVSRKGTGSPLPSPKQKQPAMMARKGTGSLIPGPKQKSSIQQKDPIRTAPKGALARGASKPTRSKTAPKPAPRPAPKPAPRPAPKPAPRPAPKPAQKKSSGKQLTSAQKRALK